MLLRPVLYFPDLSLSIHNGDILHIDKIANIVSQRLYFYTADVCDIDVPNVPGLISGRKWLQHQSSACCKTSQNDSLRKKCRSQKRFFCFARHTTGSLKKLDTLQGTINQSINIFHRGLCMTKEMELNSANTY